MPIRCVRQRNMLCGLMNVRMDDFKTCSNKDIDACLVDVSLMDEQECKMGFAHTPDLAKVPRDYSKAPTRRHVHACTCLRIQVRDRPAVQVGLNTQRGLT